jgi:hypothetical protein
MERRELEKLIVQYKEAYPEPGPLEVTDVVSRIEHALNGVGYLKLHRTKASCGASPMIEAKAVFKPNMRPRALAAEDVVVALQKEFANAPTLKIHAAPTAEGADFLILARSRPEAPVDCLLHLESA